MARVRRSVAARELDVARSTVTRWVASHPALLDAAGLVDIEELRRHRDLMINPKLQTRGAASASAMEPRDPDLAGEPAPESEHSATVSVPGSALNDHRARTEAAKAMGAELDLADRLDLTLERRSVEAALADAGEKLRQTANNLVRDRADRLARITDAREMERALDELMRELMRTAARALEMALGPRRDEIAAAQRGRDAA